MKQLENNLPPLRLSLSHEIDRIEPIEENAVIIGSYESGLGLTALGLQDEPWLGATWYEPDAEVADERSHSFNYTTTPSSVLIGFPTITYPDEHTWNNPIGIDMRFFTLDPDLNWEQSGALKAKLVENDADGCLVSCEDWYGSARPFFLGQRVYALLNYELISAELFGAEVIENTRVDALSLLTTSAKETR